MNYRALVSAKNMTSQFDYRAVADAYERIKKCVHRTSVFTSSSLDNMVGAHVFLKAELLQKTGSFKARGAVNAVMKLKSEQDVKHVITHSSGNHGQALAYAAKAAGVECTVVVPRNAPAPKVDAIRGYGAKIVECEPSMEARKTTCERIMAETGAVLVHPHDDYDVMAGQGTIAVEFLEQVPILDAIIVPVGGGGMISGIAAWSKHANALCKVFAVEPEGKHLEQSLRAGRVICEDSSKLLDTVADGMRVPGLGERCFPVMLNTCEREVFTVNDAEIVPAMKLIWNRLKLVIEPSSATGVAALFTEKFKQHRSKLQNVGVILCGGNVDLDRLPWMEQH